MNIIFGCLFQRLELLSLSKFGASVIISSIIIASGIIARFVLLYFDQPGLQPVWLFCLEQDRPVFFDSITISWLFGLNNTHHGYLILFYNLTGYLCVD